MKIKQILIVLTLACFVHANAQTNTQETADAVMNKAYTLAKKENKKVLLMFHASWCGWCKRMDANMEKEEVKAYFDKSFVITHLTVLEAKDKKHLENPGAMQMMEKYKGGKSGIPYWLIFNSKGKLLADSRDEKGQNIGCPATEVEVVAFLAKLKKTTRINKKEQEAVAKAFIIKE